MKKLIASVLMATTLSTNAMAVSYRGHPIPHKPSNFSIGYNKGYTMGYHDGKSDNEEKVHKAIAATLLISIGAVVIYNLVTNSNEKPRDITHYSVRF